MRSARTPILNWMFSVLPITLSPLVWNKYTTNNQKNKQRQNSDAKTRKYHTAPNEAGTNIKPKRQTKKVRHSTKRAGLQISGNQRHNPSHAINGFG